jgi:hypothetical protein
LVGGGAQANSLAFPEQSRLVVGTLAENLPREVFSLRLTVSKRYGERWCQKHLADQHLPQLLEKVDINLTEEARLKGCSLCGGKLPQIIVRTLKAGNCHSQSCRTEGL